MAEGPAAVVMEAVAKAVEEGCSAGIDDRAATAMARAAVMVRAMVAAAAARAVLVRSSAWRPRSCQRRTILQSCVTCRSPRHTLSLG